MIEPLVKAHLRHHAQQAFLNAVGIILVVAMLLTIASTSFVPGSRHSGFAVAVREAIDGMAWVITGTAILVLATNRISQVRDRTREFAILRVLGGSFGFIVDLLLQETIMVALPGMIAGIALAQINDSLINVAFHGLFTVRTPYMLWLPAGVLAATCFFAASLFSARSTMKLDVLEALGEEG